jgi:hypothetical protein
VLMVNDTLFAHGGVLPHHGAPARRAARRPRRRTRRGPVRCGRS